MAAGLYNLGYEIFWNTTAALAGFPPGPIIAGALASPFFVLAGITSGSADSA
ncbi:hypothetical protein [Rhodococcus sp. NPDC076796]|uniref:hypothetical protein n=1 Tax=Rhodococcus sp. NPDC076796 TaxID=3154859 RepID=UPI002AD61E88|nr:hypothetical protein [Rhodococcus sp. (in: high G+C Gram-positive bacteria)]